MIKLKLYTSLLCAGLAAHSSTQAFVLPYAVSSVNPIIMGAVIAIIAAESARSKRVKILHNIGNVGMALIGFVVGGFGWKYLIDNYTLIGQCNKALKAFLELLESKYEELIISGIADYTQIDMVLQSLSRSEFWLIYTYQELTKMMVKLNAIETTIKQVAESNLEVSNRAYKTLKNISKVKANITQVVDYIKNHPSYENQLNAYSHYVAGVTDTVINM